ncbi:MAG: MotA/TolQ/ExbB proton channel family protein [Bacteroidia bacterium]
MLTIFLQDGLLDQPMEEKLSILNLLIKGGWIMIPLFLLFVLAIYIFFERYLSIKKGSVENPTVMNKIKDYIKEGDLDLALDLCQRTNTPITRMVEKGLTRIGTPLKEIHASVENVGNLEVYKLEKNLATMATISGAAPMIGFLGTVTGMIKAFYNLSKAGNNIDPGQLAGGIYEAMVTTAFGLGVGIIAYVGYNYLTSLVEKLVYRMEATSVEFIDLLQEPAHSE